MLAQGTSPYRQYVEDHVRIVVFCPAEISNAVLLTESPMTKPGHWWRHVQRAFAKSSHGFKSFWAICPGFVISELDALET